MHDRLTPDLLARLPELAEAITRRPRRAFQREENVRHHLEAFGNNVPHALAAMASTLKPSTYSTYVKIARNLHPELELSRFAHHARKLQLQPENRPKSAETLSPSQLRRLLNDSAPHMRNSLTLMILTAGRAVDLQHFSASLVDGLWKIEMICRVDPVDGLIAPKSDPQATRRIVKWLPQGDFDPSDPSLSTMTWKDVDSAVKALFPHATPHSIRNSVIKFLEARGYTTPQIATISGHAQTAVPGMLPYITNRPNDDGTKMCLFLVSVIAREMHIRTAWPEGRPPDLPRQQQAAAAPRLVLRLRPREESQQ